MTRTMSVLLVTVVGCGSGSPVTGPERPKTIQAVTPDGVTNVGPSPVIQS